MCATKLAKERLRHEVAGETYLANRRLLHIRDAFVAGTIDPLADGVRGYVSLWHKPTSGSSAVVRRAHHARRERDALGREVQKRPTRTNNEVASDVP